MLQTTLKNGLKVIVEENHAAKVVAAQVWVRVGSADESPEDAGLAHVHEHMLFKGTARRKVGEIAATIEAAGGDINAWTSFDETVYHVTMPSRELDVALDILSDAVQHSAFDAEELTKELEVVLEELRRGKDTPGRVASEMLFKAAFEKHTYGRPVIGYEETVKAFTRDQIVRFYRRWYQPRNMCLVVVGDVKADEVVKKAETLFESDLNQGEAPARNRPGEPAQTGMRVTLAHQDIQETHLALAWHGPALKSEDTPAFDILSIVMGSGESSRLSRRVKREQELVNDCYAFAYTPQDPGLFVVGSQVHGDRIEDATRALLREAWRMTHEEPELAEVEKAKTIVLSDAVYAKETVQGVARKLGYYELVAGGTEFEKTYYDAIRKVTVEDVRRVAEKYLTTDGLIVSALMPDAHKDALTEAKVRALAAEEAEALAKEHAREHVEPGALGVVKTQLSNGITLMILPDDAVPLVSIRTASKGGLLSETERDNGVTHLVGELIVRGTTKYSAEQIMDETDAMAGGLYGVSGRNSLGLRGDFLKDSWSRGFELFASSLLEPVFDEGELEKERKIQLEDIAARQDSMSTVAFQQFTKALYGAYPYGMPTIGTKESVSSLTRDDVLRTFRTQMRTDDNMVITVVGDVDVGHTIRMIEKRIGAAQPHADAKSFVLPTLESTPTEAKTVHTAREKEQAHLVLGFSGVTMNDERKAALDVLSSVLGGQSGRLFLELRDKQSLAYSVGAFSLEGLQPGYFAVYIGTAPDKLETAERGIRLELQKVLDDPITEAELLRAQRYLIGSHEISLQRAASRCGTMALNEVYGLGYAHHTGYAERVQAVTAAQIRDVARDLIRFDRSVRSIVSAQQPS